MAQRTETVTWHDPAERLPPAERPVLISVEGDTYAGAMEYDGRAAGSVIVWSRFGGETVVESQPRESVYGWAEMPVGDVIYDDAGQPAAK